MATIQQLIIYGTLPGTEEMIQAAKAGRHIYNNMKRTQTSRVALEASVCRLQACLHPVRLEIDWVEPNQRRDLDNIQGGTKFICDGLRARGILHNDGWRYVGGITHHFFVDEKLPRVVVRLREII